MKSKGILENSQFRGMLFAVIAIFVGDVTLNALFRDNVRNLSVTNDIASATFSLFAFILFLRVWLVADSKDTSRKIWGYISLGLFLWAIAESIWGYYEIILNVDVPYPSSADFFWLLGYIPLAWGLVARYQSLGVTLSLRRRVVLASFSGVILLLTIYFVFRPIFADFDPQRLVEGLLNIFYPLFDLGLLILGGLILLSVERGRFSLTWGLIVVGFISMSLSDLFYSYLTWNDLYYPDGGSTLASILVDVSYDLPYLLFALGAYAYSVLLQVRGDIKLWSDKSGALKNSKVLVFVNSQYEIISASDNFMLLANIADKAQYDKKPLGQMLGLDASAVDSLMKKIMTQGSVSNFPLTMRNGTEGKSLLLSAVAIPGSQNQYDGSAGIVMVADLSADGRPEPPLTSEQRALAESFLARTGGDARQDVEILKAYFAGQLRLLYSLVYEFNGKQVAESLLGFLQQKSSENNWGIGVTGLDISIPEEYEGQVLATGLSNLLWVAHSFAADTVSISLIKDEMSRLDRELKPDVLQVIDRYELRGASQSAM